MKVNTATLLLICVVFLGNGCGPDYGGKIRIVLNRYDQINSDFHREMRQIHKRPDVENILKSVSAIKARCEKVYKIDTSEIPQDFIVAFKNLVAKDCENLDRSDFTTYPGDPELAAYHQAERQLEEVCTRYGYVYKHDTSPK